jgi:hypothetical protein
MQETESVLYTRQARRVIMKKMHLRQILVIGLTFIGVAVSTADSAAQTVLGRTGRPRLAVKPAKGTLALGEVSTIRISILDPYNKPRRAETDLNLMLTMTIYETLEMAKGKLTGSGVQPMQLATPPAKQVVPLPRDRESVQASCIFPGTATDLILRVRSDRPGRVRIFAEAGKLFPGAAIVSVTAPSSGVVTAGAPPNHATGLLVPIAWPVKLSTPSSFSNSDSDDFYLVIVQDGLTQYADLDSRALVDHFYIGLNDEDGNPRRAPQPIDVLLTVNRISASAAFTSHNVKIEINEAQTLEPAELRSQSPGRVTLLAEAIQDPSISVRRHELQWRIEPPFQATALALYLDRKSALASGLDGIRISIKPGQKMPDGSWRFLRPVDEGLPKREVLLGMDKGFGFRFADGLNKIEIPKDRDSGDMVVYGALPTDSLKITARSSGFFSDAEGETTVSFYWPWLYLLWAALGGLAYRLLTGWNRPTYLAWGVIFAVFFFCLACWGAIALGDVTIGGLDVQLAKIPIAHPLGPIILGFFLSWFLKREHTAALKKAVNRAISRIRGASG